MAVNKRIIRNKAKELIKNVLSHNKDNATCKRKDVEGYCENYNILKFAGYIVSSGIV